MIMMDHKKGNITEQEMNIHNMLVERKEKRKVPNFSVVHKFFLGSVPLSLSFNTKIYHIYFNYSYMLLLHGFQNDCHFNQLHTN